MSKRYDCYTTLDAQDRMTGHFCMETPGCFHCMQGVPFVHPSLDWMPRLSRKALDGVEQRVLRQIDEAMDALTMIIAERAARGDDA